MCVLLYTNESQALTTHGPAAVIFILGFVIYRSERKLNTAAQSHRKWVSDHPLQLLFNSTRHENDPR